MTGSIRRRAVALATAIALTGSLAACGTVSDSAEGSDAESREVDSIVFDFPYTSLPVWTVLVDYAQQRADELRVTLHVTNDGENLATQVSNLEGYVAQGVDAIVSLPMDKAGLSGIAQGFIDQGGTWVTYGADMEPQSGSLQFSFRESGRLLGEEAGRWAVENLGGKGKVLVLGHDTDYIGMERAAGIVEGLKAAAPDVEIVAQQQGHTPELGLSVTTSVLAQHPDLNLVVAATSDGAQGAYQALLQSGRPANDPTTWVGGVDSNLFMLEQMAAGTFARGMVTFDPQDLGDAIIDLPIAIQNGEADDDTYDVPVYLVTPTDTAEIESLISGLKG